MKALRLFVLLLLAVLLPLRGAVAATMVCAEMGQSTGGVSAAGKAHHGMHGDHAQLAGPAHGAAHAHGADHAGPGADAEMLDAAGQDGGTPSSSDTCHICASGCHAAPLAATAPVVLGPAMTAKVVFPTLCESVPDFQSDGQERPPRTI